MTYRRGDPLVNKKPLFRLASCALTWFVELLGWPIIVGMYRFRVVGGFRLRKAFSSKKRQAFVLVSNHAIPLDPLFHGLAILPRLTYFTLLEETVLTPVLGTLLRLLGGIPIPTDPEKLRDIESAVAWALEKRGLVHFYPEGECFLLNQDIKTFRAGAFYYAIKFGSPVIPLATVLKRTKGRLNAEVHVLEALKPPSATGRASADLHAALEFAENTQKLMQAHIDMVGGDKSLYKGPMPRIRGVNDTMRE
jgi:1-acyl-sn-glycerol-3-phosphate acyltransferase